MFESSDSQFLPLANETGFHLNHLKPNDLNLRNEDNFAERLDLITSDWKNGTAKESQLMKCLIEYQDKLFRINSSSSIPELMDIRNFFMSLLDFRKDDQVILHYLKVVTFQIQKRHEQEQKELGFSNSTEIDRLAKALASIQAQNDASAQQQTQFQIPEEKRTATLLGSSNITEIAKALADIQINGDSSLNETPFIPMPPGWNSKQAQGTKNMEYHQNWNPDRLPYNCVPAQLPNVPLAIPPTDSTYEALGTNNDRYANSPPQIAMELPRNQHEPPLFPNQIKAERSVDARLNWNHHSQTYENYHMQPQQPKAPRPGPATANDAVPSPSEIGGDEFLEEEKPVLRNSAWKAVGCTAKPPQAPATMAAILKMSLTTESKFKSYNIASTPEILSKPKPEAVSPMPRPVESNGTKSVDIWESSEEESESHSDPLTDPKNPLQATSVWVGNLTPNIEKEMLYPHFMRIGYISNIVMAQENHCAFVNFENPRAAGRAMRDLQGLVIEGVKLLLRYPNRFLGGDHTFKLKDSTAIIPGRPKRGGPAFQSSPKKPHKKGTK